MEPFAGECSKSVAWMDSILSSVPDFCRMRGESIAERDYKSQIDEIILSLQKETTRSPSETPSSLNGTAESAEYLMSDEYGETDSSEFYATDAETIHGQKIPTWARAAQLKSELEAQISMDPEKIFANLEMKCGIDDIFGPFGRDSRRRSDSGKWEEPAVQKNM